MIPDRELLPFEKRARYRNLGLAQETSLASLSTYSAHGSSLAQLAGLDHFHPAALSAGAGLLGAYYGYRGARDLIEADDTFTRILAGADLVTGFGLVAQALGGGTWAAALSATGLVTTTALHLWNHFGEEQ